MPKTTKYGGASAVSPEQKILDRHAANPAAYPLQQLSVRAVAIICGRGSQSLHEVARQLEAIGEALPAHYPHHAAPVGGNGWWYGAVEYAIEQLDNEE